jgi:hypothetical protein
VSSITAHMILVFSMALRRLLRVSCTGGGKGGRGSGRGREQRAEGGKGLRSLSHCANQGGDARIQLCSGARAHLVVLVRAVAEVEAGHVHTGAQQLLYHLHRPGHRAQGADHLGGSRRRGKEQLR